MCIIGCSPKLNMYDLFRSIKNEIIAVDDISSKKDYDITQIKISFDEILKLINNKLEGKFENILKNYIRKKIKIINFSRAEYAYQGGIMYVKGEVCNYQTINKIMNGISLGVYYGREDIKNSDYKSLRPTTLDIITQSKKNNLDIRLLFVFAHNKHIKSHFYNRKDWIHKFSPAISKKYLKYNKNLKEESWDQGIKIFLLTSIDQINDVFKKKLISETKLVHSIAILSKNKKIFNKLSEFTKNLKLSRGFVICA